MTTEESFTQAVPKTRPKTQFDFGKVLVAIGKPSFAGEASKAKRKIGAQPPVPA